MGPKSGHTKGPWEVHQDGSARVCNGDHASEEGCRTIAEAEILNVPRMEAAANARLIAAVPDLLEVARLLIRCCSRRDGSLAPYEDWIMCFVEDGSTITDIVERAQAALVKAGE